MLKIVVKNANRHCFGGLDRYVCFVFFLYRSQLSIRSYCVFHVVEELRGRRSIK